MLAFLIGFFFRLGEKHISGNILFTNTEGQGCSCWFVFWTS